jgi:hypothetical protein
MIGTPRGLPAWWAVFALGLCALVVVAGLNLAAAGGGATSLALVVIAWAAMTALASGVVRELRATRPTSPAPPVAAATLGSIAAGLVLGDIADLPALARRLSAFVVVLALLLALLRQTGDLQPGRRRCRAGLFVCALPAWPAGSWRELMHWPALLAGLAMLPMMAALPLLAAWCRSQSVAPQTLVLLHLAAMFGPVLFGQKLLTRCSQQRLAAICAGLLATGALFAAFVAPPLDMLGLALAHGAAWGLAWGGQLWAPARRGQLGSSPLVAALGYALLTLAFGFLVARFGVRALVTVHVALGLVAALSWFAATWLRPGRNDGAAADMAPEQRDTAAAPVAHLVVKLPNAEPNLKR